MNFVSEKRKVERLKQEGLKGIASNDHKSAWRAFEEILYLDEDDPLANTCAASLLNLGRFDEAEVLARKGARLAPQLALTHRGVRTSMKPERT